MPVELRTIEGVPIVETGTFPCASGVHTFTAEDIAAAIEAFADPTVSAPRLKLGHDDPRPGFDGVLDGEPAFGTATNLRASEDGQTLFADFVDVPAWLADTMESSYPGRSIEGGFGMKAPSGRAYEFAVSAVALLGVEWPGISSLDDLREVLEANGEAPEDANALVAAGGELRETISATMSRDGNVSAGLDVDLVRRRFVDALDDGSYDRPEGSPEPWSWWPRSLRIEDDGTLVLIADADGYLYSIEVDVTGAEVSFGDAAEVIEEYRPVAASAAPVATRRVAQWRETRAARRPANDQEADSPMTDEQRRVLARALGQPEDTTEDRLHEIAASRAAESESAPEGGTGTTPPVAASGGEGGEGGTPPAARVEVPEGMVLVDEQTLAALRTGAESGVAASRRFAEQDRDAVIRAAIEDEGRIAAAAADHWRTRWDRDPEGTRTLLTASVEQGGLPTDTIPTGMREVGRSGDGEGDPQVADAAHEDFMATHNPQAYARIRARGDRPGVRVRQEA